MDAVLNLGLPAPIDIQVSGFDLKQTFDSATRLAQRLRAVPGVADVYVPQDIDYPALRFNIDRARAIELGLDQKEVVQNVITALNSQPAEVDHYQLGRVIDVYVRPEGEDLGRIADAVSDITGKLKLPANTEVDIRGMVQNMRTSFHSFALGLLLALALLYFTWF